ncbi:MAG: NUDIX domain-containing protein [Eubacteriales bacterium]
MEYFDILDKHANPIGQIAEKGTSLGEGKYYMGVNGYIVTPEGLFLLQQRAYNKYIRPGCWDILMGHVMAGESSKEAIIRETQEEIGLLIEERNLHFIQRFLWKDAQIIIDIYFIIITIDQKALVLQEDEVIKTKLISKEEMISFVQEMTYHTQAYRNLILEAIEHVCINISKF